MKLKTVSAKRFGHVHTLPTHATPYKPEYVFKSGQQMWRCLCVDSLSRSCGWLNCSNYTEKNGRKR